ncbi:hypothetical protein LEP1GSC202_0130 [Leptospira yanagawae serovar Saopaulo str. Sao Paulo = ATCC 700523]|uniref:PF07611 family protein n=1 Tax=Leptospira yanagawae serovar Saopaulo str. Sao Paulo = ATCC 700523 TaxID=1249483 RepID=A0A5E8H872_9LEPT|nr:hypothetical protein [Leptospira yanagawae]EOQ87042.1 hypothetical protein LEP1GSC202_0130 [Leptospira yanagawae serovar Saopaulo str. Sao Paulo = ATCC 700523]
MKKRIGFIICFLVFLLGIDYLFFRKIQFLLPNESPWNTNHFFNFLYEYERIRSLPKTKKRIIIVGSSVAYYSIDAKALEKVLFEKYSLDVDVFYLAYAGNSPLYVYLLLGWLEPLAPDLVVYPVNFIDYRLHRTYVLFPEGRNDTVEESVMVQDALTFTEAPQSLWVFPWETIREVGSAMDMETFSRYLVSSAFHFYRYKDIFEQNLQNLFQHRFGRNTSYHSYMGVSIPEGVNGLGWTGKQFSFFPTKKMEEKGFWLEVTEFLLSGSTCQIEFSNGETKQIVELNQPRWTKIQLDPAFFRAKKQITATLARVWYAHEASGAYLDYHWDPMGVRLEQTFGLEKPKNGVQYIREPRTEDFRYSGMDDETYTRYFYYRLLEGLEKRPGIGYLVALKNAKERIRNEKFRPIFHFDYIQKIADHFRNRNISFLLINNPENPISLRWYEGSDWYKDHLQYLQSLESGSVHFWDIHNALPMQGFSDFHHFTYVGMEQMNSIYAERIGNLFPK